MTCPEDAKCIFMILKVTNTMNKDWKLMLEIIDNR